MRKSLALSRMSVSSSGDVALPRKRLESWRPKKNMMKNSATA